MNANIEIKFNEAGAEMTHRLIDEVISQIKRLRAPKALYHLSTI